MKKHFFDQIITLAQMSNKLNTIRHAYNRVITLNITIGSYPEHVQKSAKSTIETLADILQDDYYAAAIEYMRNHNMEYNREKIKEELYNKTVDAYIARFLKTEEFGALANYIYLWVLFEESYKLFSSRDHAYKEYDKMMSDAGAAVAVAIQRMQNPNPEPEPNPSNMQEYTSEILCELKKLTKLRADDPIIKKCGFHEIYYILKNLL